MCFYNQMKRILCLLLLLPLLPCKGWGQTDSICHEVLFQTSMGDIKVMLYNDTPRHRDNLLRLVRSGYYDGNLFHRVIARFMVQTGDSTTRHAQPKDTLGAYAPPYTLKAEINFPKRFHKRGALAAAREPDEVNPERESSSAQIYFVFGKRFNEDALDRVQDRISTATQGKIVLPPEVRKYYCEHGGTPHLDGQYTVFGEIIEGLDVIERMHVVATDKNDRPLEDVRILRATVVK